MIDARQLKECLDKYFDVDILAFKNSQDSFLAAQALLLSLKKLNKNATLLEAERELSEKSEERREDKNLPQADFLISIKEGGAKLSRLFYEKTDAGLNLFLKTEGQGLKKEDVSLLPLNFDKLLITIGFASGEEVRLVVAEKPCLILNIDNQAENKDFGDINIVEKNQSLSEIIFDIITTLRENLFDKEIATLLVSGIAQGSEHFQKQKITEKTFQKIGFLAEQGADLAHLGILLPQIQSVEKSAIKLFQKVLLKMYFSLEKGLGWAFLSHNDFTLTESSPKDLKFTIEKTVSGIFPFQNLLLLWEQNSSPLAIKGFFYAAENPENLAKIASIFPSQQKGNCLLFDTKSADKDTVQNKILTLV